MHDVFFYMIFPLLSVVAVVEFIIIRGFLRTEKSINTNKHLTGREIEEVRRKLSTVGLNGISKWDILNLIKTIRDTHLGTYVDEDPYVPADPYEDVE